MPQGGSIITYCKNWPKNIKDPYNLGLASNSIRLALKEIILQQRTGSPSIYKRDRYCLIENVKVTFSK